jgi:hypothetical protein
MTKDHEKAAVRELTTDEVVAVAGGNMNVVINFATLVNIKCNQANVEAPFRWAPHVF